MSMPSYPPCGADLTREQAITMIVASIAQEESALSRVIDAEGEKLQTIIKRLEADACIRDLLEANRSAARLLDVVMENQMLLRSKLALALDCGCPPPCPSPCPPRRPPDCQPPRPPRPCARERGAAQLSRSCGGFLWRPGCRLPWERCRCQGGGIRLSEEDPALVELDPRRGYSVTCQLNLCDFLPTEVSGKICLESGEDAPPPLFFSLRSACGETSTLQYAALLLPQNRAGAALRLYARGPLCVSQAVLNIVEL